MLVAPLALRCLNREVERGPLPDFTLGPHLASHRLCQPLRDGKAKPGPPVFPALRPRLFGASTWLNDSKSRSRFSFGMPMPVSCTLKWSSYVPSGVAGDGATRSWSLTSPSSVHLTASDSRLGRTWRSRARSPRVTEGTAESIRQVRSMPCSAVPANQPAVLAGVLDIDAR